MADRDLKIVISAVNNAKRQMDEAVGQLNQMSTSMKGVKTSSDSMTTSVFKGTAAYDILRTGIREATAFLKDSFAESLEASRIMAQVATDVKNAGFSYEELAPKIKAYGDAALQLGFDDEKASQSLSKLLLVTKDYSQAVALSNLAMDLSRNKNIDLDAATRQVTLATQGNVKELKLLGIELDENATTADNLKKMQDQLKDSAVSFANTAGGQIQVLTQEYNNLKQKVGDDLTPVMIELLNIVSQQKGTITGFADGFIFLAQSVGYALKGIVGLIDTVGVGVTGFVEYGSKDISIITKGLNKIGIVSDEGKDKVAKWADQYKGAMDIAANSTLDLYNKVPVLTKTLVDNSIALATIKDKSKTSGKALEDLKEVVTKATDEYKTFNEEASNALSELEDNHKESLSSMTLDISRVQKELKDLASTYRTDLASAMSSYNNSTKDNAKSAAEAIVSNQEAIAKLQNNIASGTMAKEDKLAAEAELATRLQAETDNATLIASLSNEIAAVKAYNALSELGQALFDYQQKKALAETEYNESVARIRGEYNERKTALTLELNDLKTKQKEEQVLYEAKRIFIEAQRKEALVISIAFANSSISITKAQIEAEIAYYKQLAEAIKAARSANTSQFSRIQGNVSSIVSTVPNLSRAATEAFTPLKNGQDINGLTLNINTMVGNRQFAEEMGNQIIKTLQLQEQL